MHTEVAKSRQDQKSVPADANLENRCRLDLNKAVTGPKVAAKSL